jgi:tetratricopeptide (TPR) repeat protein
VPCHAEDQSNKDFSIWNNRAGEIRKALDANDMAAAQTAALNLMSEASKANTPAAMATACMWIGEVQLHNRQYDEAIGSFKATLVELDKYGAKPGDERYDAALRWLATCYVNTNRISDAKPIFIDLVKVDRERQDRSQFYGGDLYQKAVCDYRSGNYSAAETEAQEACKFLLFASPRNAETTSSLIHAMHTVAKAEITLSKFDDAENACKMALALEHQYHSSESPTSLRIILDLSQAQLSSGKYSEAQDTLQKIIEPLSHEGGWPYVTALAHMAKVNSEQGKFAEAVTSYRQMSDLLSSDPKLKKIVGGPSMYFDYASALAHTGALSDAEKYFDDAASSTDLMNDADRSWSRYALFELAALYRQQGDTKRERQATERFINLRDAALDKQLGGAVNEVSIDGKPASTIHKWVVCAEKDASTLSDTIVSNLKTGLKSIPESVQKRLQAAGFLIVIVPTMEVVLYDPAARPIGYGSGATYSNEQAHTAAPLAAVMLAEKYMPSRTHTWAESPEISYAIRHELGHALDLYLLRFSDRKEFIQAYADDTKEIQPAAKRSLAYYLQPGSTGRNETFAELVGIEWGTTRQSEDMKAQFPHCIQLVKTRLANLDKSTKYVQH